MPAHAHVTALPAYAYIAAASILAMAVLVAWVARTQSSQGKHAARHEAHPVISRRPRLRQLRKVVPTRPARGPQKVSPLRRKMPSGRR